MMMLVRRRLLDGRNVPYGMILFVRNLFLAIAVLLSSSKGVMAWPKAEVNSREYKTMLNATLFIAAPSSSSSSKRSVWHNLERDLSQAAAAAGAPAVHGHLTFKEGTPRRVQFYDTEGTCWLRHHSLTLRFRKAVFMDDNDDDDDNTSTTKKDSSSSPLWEGMLKSRSGDRYHTTARRRYMNDCNAPAVAGSRKLEEDIAHFDWTGNVYSFSQKCHTPIVQKDDYFTVGHAARVWDRMQEYLSAIKVDLDLPLQLVSHTTVLEVVWEDFWIVLEGDGHDDDQTAQAKVTLWYHDNLGDENTTAWQNSQQLAEYLTTTQVPIVAELSVLIKSKHEAWSDTTIMTMHDFWEHCASYLQRQQWLNPHSMTKTAWIYQYDPMFCQTSSSNDNSDDNNNNKDMKIVQETNHKSDNHEDDDDDSGDMT